MFHYLSAIFVLSLTMPSASMATAKKTMAEPRLIYRVICPNDRKLREMVTTQAEGEDFIVECSNPMFNSPMEGIGLLSA